GESFSCKIERFVPAGAAAVDFGNQQAPLGAQRLAERRPFRTQAARIGGMGGVALHLRNQDLGVKSDEASRCPVFFTPDSQSMTPGEDPTADTAIGACGAHLGSGW